MTGNYLLFKEVSIIPPHSIALFKFDGISIILRDIRRFGSLDFYASNQVIPKIEKLGTEPLSEGFSYKCLADKLSGRKRAVKETLIDQTIIAGLGNIYASEILFKARVHPSVPSGRLSQSKIKRIVDSTKEILNLAIEKAGTTISDYKTPDSKSGDFQNFLQVYGKANKPCSTCGSLIQRAVINQRSTFFCPRCQKI
jgi:formamidopyrimidine-DNA glycosylase